jgi:hypothetical protein
VGRDRRGFEVEDILYGVQQMCLTGREENGLMTCLREVSEWPSCSSKAVAS